ncbi:M56 family metallopeptidase [Niabella beijingensis]|uniref:M56 family metallopeptidase n=1 Tax=Niabella beijingensis TaxID=2872700 RepID=UPI001CC19E00|nr:M56 family metallopeptidase [Niabella beijingensis]MBZ4190515.1 TonB-dependent receptor plug domain-containing protein [Niabella beijingensis]
MPVIIDYILKVSICLAVVYLFYQLFLRRLTFYGWNRWYLLGYSALSFVIPLIDIMPELQRKALDRNALVQLIPVFGFSPEASETSLLESLSAWDWVMVAGVLGSLVLLLRFMIMFLSFLRIRKKAQLISDDNTRIYQLDEEVRPFSFGNAIFINTELHSGEELEEIIRHEFVHVRQKHTIDIIWSELLCILLWFNPFVWLLRKSIKQNLEFLADKQVLQGGMDKKEYQYLLLKVMGNKQFAFANHFNFSSLKNRIAMMNTIRSAKIHLAKFLFLLPVVAVLLLAFRKEIKEEAPAMIAGNTGNEMQPSGNTGNTASLVPDNADDKNAFSYLEKVAAANALKKPVYILDLRPVAHGTLQQLPETSIGSISILKGTAAVAQYGSKGKNGVIEIFSKSYDNAHSNLYYHSDAGLRIKPGRKDTVPPLFVIDGVKKAVSNLSGLNPDEIQSIDVLKNSSATSLYGDEGKNGVVLITTKKGFAAKSDSAGGKKVFAGTVTYSYHTGEGTAASGGAPLKGKVSGVTIVQHKVTTSGDAVSKTTQGADGSNRTQKAASGITFRNTTGNEKAPLYVINGRPATQEALSIINGHNIESVSIVKDASAQALYGEAGRNGVVLVTTKTGSTSKKDPLEEVTVTGYGIKKEKNEADNKKEQPELKPVIVEGYKKENKNESKSLPPTTYRQMPSRYKNIPATIRYTDAAATATARSRAARNTAAVQRAGSRAATTLILRPVPAEKAVAKNEPRVTYRIQVDYSGSIKETGQNSVTDTIRVYDKVDHSIFFERNRQRLQL